MQTLRASRIRRASSRVEIHLIMENNLLSICCQQIVLEKQNYQAIPNDRHPILMGPGIQCGNVTGNAACDQVMAPDHGHRHPIDRCGGGLPSRDKQIFFFDKMLQSSALSSRVSIALPLLSVARSGFKCVASNSTHCLPLMAANDRVTKFKQIQLSFVSKCNRIQIKRRNRLQWLTHKAFSSDNSERQRERHFRTTALDCSL